MNLHVITRWIDRPEIPYGASHRWVIVRPVAGRPVDVDEYTWTDEQSHHVLVVAHVEPSADEVVNLLRNHYRYMEADELTIVVGKR